MPEKPFADALNEQIANEFGAHQQYVGAAVYYESETLPRLAAFFYRQAVEERNHAMMMVQHLLDANQEVRIPDIDATSSTCSLMNHWRNCSLERSPSLRASAASVEICSLTFFYCSTEMRTGSTRSPKPTVGAFTPGTFTSAPASSRYCTIIIAWLRSSSACA